MRRFELHRDEDVSGISGTGIVAEGVVCNDGTAMLHWVADWPSSHAVYCDRGMEAIELIHGHDGRTRIVWLDG